MSAPAGMTKMGSMKPIMNRTKKQLENDVMPISDSVLNEKLRTGKGVIVRIYIRWGFSGPKLIEFRVTQPLIMKQIDRD